MSKENAKMEQNIACNIIKRFDYEKYKLYLLVDTAHVEIAQSIKRQHANTQVLTFPSYAPKHIKKFFDLPLGATVLLLAQPESYIKYQLFNYLDFSKGEPHIRNTMSRVLISPKDSLCRIFSQAPEKDILARNNIIANMKTGQKYRITTTKGTDLVFESRHWIPLDFEVCTAPIEKSVNGTIVVDGALFFKKIETNIIFKIKNGKIHSIESSSSKGEKLVAEYRTMTARDMQNPFNTQLAEIGIGFCNGAMISDCFMEAEAAINTCHFCFGNNICYGGNNESEFHGASLLIKNPVFTCI